MPSRDRRDWAGVERSDEVRIRHVTIFEDHASFVGQRLIRRPQVRLEFELLRARVYVRGECRDIDILAQFGLRSITGKEEGVAALRCRESAREICRTRFDPVQRLPKAAGFAE